MAIVITINQGSKYNNNDNINNNNNNERNNNCSTNCSNIIIIMTQILRRAKYPI